jgi:hypothetical protein
MNCYRNGDHASSFCCDVTGARADDTIQIPPEIRSFETMTSRKLACNHSFEAKVVKNKYSEVNNGVSIATWQISKTNDG